MATLKQDLKITTPKESFSFYQQEPYSEVFTIRKVVDNTDGFMTLWSGSKTAGTYGYDDVKAMVIKNTSKTPVEIQMAGSWYEGSTSASVDTYSALRYTSWLLKSEEYMYLPGIRMVGYDSDHSAANAGTVDSVTGYSVASTLEVDSTADVDTATDGAMASGTTTTTLYLEPYTSATNCTANLFRVGDLVRLENEICEVTAIGDKSDLANNYLTVIRGVHGSTAATHADDVSVDLPFFNATGVYDKYTYVQTDESGNYKAKNLFGYGRNLTEACTGIVPGSIAIKFYSTSYQELGLSGINASTESGLTASTAYGFNITVDGGSEFTDLSITTDASNLKFGGTNGIISKINAVFEEQFRTSGSALFEKRVMVHLVDGDIRFTSRNRTRVSNVVLGNATGAGGVSNIFGVGRIPAIANIESTVAPKLPDDTIFTKGGITTQPNRAVFTYDDGHGNLVGGEARGNISYETGAINLNGPRNAEFSVSLVHDSAHSGGNHFGSTTQNCITQISARAINSKVNPTVEIIGFN